MGKFTILLITVSTAVLLIAFGKGLTALRAGDTAAHLYWDMATLFSVLVANFVAAIHAAQSDRLIRDLRRECALLSGEGTEPARP